MKKFLVLLLCLFVAACGKHNAANNGNAPQNNSSQSGSSQSDASQNDTSQGDDAAADLLDDVSGVWSTGDHGLLTIQYKDSDLRILFDGQPKAVKLGEIDTTNMTVNLLVTRKSDKKEVIWTLQKRWKDDKQKEFTLTLVTDTGEQLDLGFVRNISSDDETRIDDAYAKLDGDDNPLSDAGNKDGN